MTADDGERFTVREGGPDDLDTIMHHRRSMFADMGYPQDARFDAALDASRPYFEEQLRRGAYRAWFAENRNHEIVAGGGLFVLEYPSSPRDPTPRRPLIVNMYTEPAYRRNGLARQLMHIMIDWCRAQGFGSIMLHASDAGRPLYESLGFVQTNEMRLILR